MVRSLDIAVRLEDTGHPRLVIAEAGVNRNGRLKLALDLVNGALAAGQLTMEMLA
ncbi:MAG: hypothetical protein LDL07_00160 [Desulfarculus sp.]|nr:hypothetical protein [Desulfarculus sp.]